MAKQLPKIITSPTGQQQLSSYGRRLNKFGDW